MNYDSADVCHPNFTPISTNYFPKVLFVSWGTGETKIQKLSVNISVSLVVCMYKVFLCEENLELLKFTQSDH